MQNMISYTEYIATDEKQNLRSTKIPNKRNITQHREKTNLITQ